MKLIDFLDGRISVRDEVWAISSFKNLSDSRKDKDLLTKEVGYIWFMFDYFSDFENIVDPKDRAKEIIKETGMPKNWVEDDLMKDCIRFFVKYNEDDIVRLAKANKLTARRIATFLEKEDLLTDTDEVKKLAEVMKLNEVNIASLIKSDELIKNRSKESAKGIKGSQTKASLEDL